MRRNGRGQFQALKATVLQRSMCRHDLMGRTPDPRHIALKHNRYFFCDVPCQE